MRSISAVPTSGAGRAKLAGPRATLDRLRTRDRIETIARLRAAVRALGDVDVSGWDDSTLTEHLDEISQALCGIDAELTRVAEAVRARGFRIDEQRAA
ncbi:hypothetical protein GCM10010168_16640 [Actinoplanes ianthinogenes]|uniref:Uncharacterized protein n=1 Tax=Actinoplanes ianthinogenes TaxID=122358 RepID=A0ABM7LZW2_9ACTN|nr:hypothetical protein [Actinoplanes ianthinogenes]BCJ44851.1 hypothetical protein Aiant_55080 [Actinoplanes ianthinogenes]GGR00372.1 hypothetical protein GCM10010168_16640 [Actinoplanes ianthinogenes]